jgi:TolB protein
MLFGVDATMEIIKKTHSLPSINVSVSTDTGDKKLANKIKKIIKQDLQVSGHFNVSNFNKSIPYSNEPDVKVMSQNNIDLFLNIQIQQSAFEGIMLYISLFDVNSNKFVFNKSFTTSKKNRYPFLAHRSSISINKYLNAPSIDWMDKFVIFSRSIGAKKSEIVIADYTLTFQKVIVKDGLNVFPKWANKSQESFYYTTYNKTVPTLMRANLYTGKKRQILKSDGMIVASDVSEDGKKLLLTMSPKGQSDIYLYDLEKKIKTRITKYKGIDVSGNFVENDSKVVFVSDRLKHPNIFAKKIGQRGIERLVYHGRNNSSATSYKDYIVYTSREGTNEFSRGSFNLYLISTKSDFIRRLTSTGRNQFPKFSTDGESILFIKTYKGKSSLGIIRINYNKSFLFPLKSGKLQSIDW